MRRPQDSVSTLRSVALNSAATFFLGLMLGDKPRILALNKVDAMDPKQISDRRRALEKASGGEVFVISGVAGRGLQDVLREIYARIKAGNAKPEEVTPWRP